MSDLAIIQKPLAPDLIKRMAMEIGKETVAYVEYMYPEAIKATSSTFRLSLRNTIYNEIMSMMAMGDEAAIEERMDRQKSQRRKGKAFWERHRATDWDKVRAARDAEIVLTDIVTNDD